MLRTALPRPGLGVAFSAARPAAEWLFFAASLALLAGTIYGKFRGTGPAVLLGCVTVGYLLDLTDRRKALRLIAVLLTAYAAAWVLRNRGDTLLAHRGGRLVLVAGLGLSAILAVPDALAAAFQNLADRIRANPNGADGWKVAIFGVAAPVFVMQANTTEHVWTGDTMPVFPTVVQMYRHGTRDLTPYLPGHSQVRWDAVGPNRPYFVREVPGAAGLYSTYPAGMEVFAWPAVIAIDLMGYDVGDDGIVQCAEKFTAAVVAALCLAMFFLMAVHVVPAGPAFAAAWLLATGSVFNTTIGMLLWQQGGTVFWPMLAVLIEIRCGGKVGWKGLLVQALACGWVLACRPSAVTFLVPFGLWVLARDWRRGLLLPALAVTAYLPWGLLYWRLYQQPFGPAMGFLKEQWFPGEFLLGVLFSPGRGLAVYQPWTLLLPLLAVPAVRRIDARRFPTGWPAFALAAISLQVFLNASWPCWWGGSCYGSRLSAEVVPWLGLLCLKPLAWVLSKDYGWAAVAVIGLLGFAVHAPCAYYDAWLWNALPISSDDFPFRHWDWAFPPFAYSLIPAPAYGG